MSRGIVSYAAYVPRHRLQRAELGAALGSGGGKGSRSVASFDEDATTMGVEAARRTLGDGAPGSLFFATTAPAYLDKTNATAIHAALDLGHEGFALDIAGSARGATGALRAAAQDGGLAVLADVRTGRPGSADESGSGDGAAAFRFGDGDRVLAEVLGEASATAEFLDRWRAPGSHASQQWEERFGLEAYLPLVRDAARRALDAAGIEQPDHVIVSSPHARTQATAAKELAGRTAEEAPAIGYAGAADPGIRLAAVLDRAGSGETILLVVAADGCDATVLHTTDQLPSGRAGIPVAEQAASGRDIAYATFLTWRGLLEREPPRRPEPGRPAGPPSARSEAWKFAFVGSQCDVCGQVHVPPRRVCVNCRAVDAMSRAPLAGKSGQVATYTVDRLAFSPAPPMIDAVVDFEGGGRYTLEVADASPEEIEIGTPVELTFRRLYTSGGVHNYFWKVRPRG
ncbi:MAG TPA: OB-fold domain-containing protein [Baekduia sp.]|nr:OB-fold domain-containing protein [Baekduia sp.]